MIYIRLIRRTLRRPCMKLQELLRILVHDKHLVDMKPATVCLSDICATQDHRQCSPFSHINYNVKGTQFYV